MLSPPLLLPPLSLLLLFGDELELSAPDVADADGPVSRLPVIAVRCSGDGLKSPLVIASVLVAFEDVAVAELEPMLASFDVAAAFEVVGACEVAVGSALVGSAGVVCLVLVGLGASLAGAVLPVITCQSCGEGPAKVSSVTVPLHPPSPQHIHAPAELWY